MGGLNNTYRLSDRKRGPVEGEWGRYTVILFCVTTDLLRRQSHFRAIPATGLGWWRTRAGRTKVFRMKSRGSTISFGLFVVVLLGAVFMLMRGRGGTNWGLIAVLLGILVLRGTLFVVNLRQQRRNLERGKGPVDIETRLGLNDDEEEPPDGGGASQSQSQSQGGRTPPRS